MNVETSKEQETNFVFSIKREMLHDSGVKAALLGGSEALGSDRSRKKVKKLSSILLPTTDLSKTKAVPA